ncbi:MAG: glycoside hydrolase family 9 protein [Phycisphaeraceae bacterium]|nr:glycoside hydrolase family 9 protein [Phycisphaeraceae bacterium]
MTTTGTRDVQLGVSHLGYQPDSPKMLTMTASSADGLSAEIPFYLRQNCFRMARDAEQMAGFSARFPTPYHTLRGKLQPPASSSYYYRGMLRRKDWRWGTVWQADFSDWTTPGSFQIETDDQVSVPFAVMARQDDRVLLGYLRYLNAQRCGCEVFGVHPACHMDDGVLDSDGSAWPVTGGWHDAGDFRKWAFNIIWHLQALATMLEWRGDDLDRGGIGRAALLDEIRWGNRFFHGIITPEGHVYEDVAGGQAPKGAGFTYDEHWWFENHAGVYGDATDNRWTDNIPNSGDERSIRTSYNPYMQFAYAACQCRVAPLLPAAEKLKCIELAQRAWQYGRTKGHDGRTIFVACELLAAVELMKVESSAVTVDDVATLTAQLLSRQDQGDTGLHGYFMDISGEAFRSIGLSADPVLALVRLRECLPQLKGLPAKLADQAREAVTRYIDGYLLADAASNAYGLTPYGIYIVQEHADRQTFRDAGRGRGVRTFMAPLNRMGVAHGLNGLWMSHAHLLARAGVLMNRHDWKQAAERLLHWTHGHNPFNRSTNVSIGFRQPIGYSFRIPQLSDAILAGCIGWPDDKPYLEESSAIEWNTLEYWGIPYGHAAQAVCHLT